MKPILKSLIIMASIAFLTAGCTSKQESQQAQQPITKPQIVIEGGRLTPEALWAMGRINNALVDIETGLIAYTVSYYSVKENRSTSWIRICSREGNALTTIDEFVGTNPAWFGNGGTMMYLNNGKLFIRQDRQDIAVTGYGDEIEDFLLNPQRDKIVLITPVKTVPSTADKYPDLPLASGRIVTDLMYKHWDEWVENAPQPFIATLDLTYQGETDRLTALTIREPLNILAGTPYECPMRPFGGVEQLAWSPNGTELAYTCRKKAGKDYALSTTSNIYVYDLAEQTHTAISGSGGYELNPAYSPDGRFIAWISMDRDGYESDLARLILYEPATGKTRWLTYEWDSPIEDFYWRDNDHIVMSSVWHGTTMLYEKDVYSEDGRIQCLTTGQYDYVPVWTPAELSADGSTYLCLRHSMREANELYEVQVHNNTADIVQLTHENDNIYRQITMGEVLPRWQTTTDGKQMLTWIILPPDFDPDKKYPALLYCEGGPQSPVSQFWSYRWNFMMMAANDYIIVAPNRRGLPGFGSEWNEQISGDYGGQCMRDYFTAIDEACDNLPYIDRNRLGCVGASFGGYSVYWIAGHHNHRFKAFIAHDGIFNFDMQYLETEEKWFVNWDLGGAYWEKNNAVAQRTYQNSPHRFVDQWDTPILCIHGEKDYRILANQGMAAFDAAVMRGIPAELLIYPDENHWVLKPQNGVLWQRTFYEWLDRWLK